MVDRSKKALKRFLARLFDYYLFTIVVSVAIASLGLGQYLENQPDIIVFLKISVFIIFFEFACLSAYGTTPGKFTMGIYVLDRKKQHMDIVNNLLRTSIAVLVFGVSLNLHFIAFLVVMAICALFYIYGFSMFWDKFSSSVVYYKKWDFVNYIFSGFLLISTIILLIYIISNKLEEGERLLLPDSEKAAVEKTLKDGELLSPFSGGQGIGK